MESPIKVVIPARFGSSRLPGKPLLLINNKPIFWHVVQRVLEAGVLLRDIVIATDDLRIQQSAEALNMPAMMTSLAHVSGTDRINEVATLNNWSNDTIILNVQGDEPLIPAHLIRQLFLFTQVNSQFDITTAVSAISTRDDFVNPNVVKAILGQNNRALYFTRSSSPFNRDQPDCLTMAFSHIGIYAYRKLALQSFCAFPEAPLEKYEKLEQLRALSNGMKIGAIVIDEAPAHGVDTLQDYQHLKKIMEIQTCQY
jgi:3-deoxy-manno-octulosonate cytidylyltransferase (CMP-KDO synthetase)